MGVFHQFYGLVDFNPGNDLDLLVIDPGHRVPNCVNLLINRLDFVDFHVHNRDSVPQIFDQSVPQL